MGVPDIVDHRHEFFRCVRSQTSFDGGRIGFSSKHFFHLAGTVIDLLAREFSRVRGKNEHAGKQRYA
ncbi:hypothetical protein LA76x_2273 [Lysobacter antibioticus]|uniref:Uncharacterized protein n=1 Tax=Lysobacter antibioticus TaxID=84531 RepID=A0A0S2FA72_LYSAN|nr:hypothetical protein LA76x_2273 [Lysobacter antibioticus]